MNSLIFYAIILIVFPIYGIQSKLYTTPNNVIYYINELQKFTLPQAFIECSYQDMDLLTIDSKEQYDDILALLVGGSFTQKPPPLWVGAIGNGKKFDWIYTGNPIKPYLWCTGCPNAVDGVRCIKFCEKYGLNNYGCSNKIGFICQKRVKPEDCCAKESNITLNVIQNNKCTK